MKSPALIRRDKLFQVCIGLYKKLTIKNLEFSKTFHTTSARTFLYDKLFEKSKMSGSYERVTVKLKKEGMLEYKPAHFCESIVDFIDPKNETDVTTVQAELLQNRLCISSPDGRGSNIKIKRPPFCPIHHLTKAQKDGLPEEIMSRGIDCGAAVLLESGDGKILLTRRGNHLRTFPGIWVPPGGHIEQNETLTNAGLRELFEETGLSITPDMCCESQVNVIAMWESVFPPKLSLGLPKRHHAVIYLHAKLKPDITSISLTDKLQIDPNEVGAAAWFDQGQVHAISLAKEGATPAGFSDEVQKLSTSIFSAIVLNEDKEQIATDLPFSDLLKVSGDEKDQLGRVSTGTKFALEEWLNKIKR